MLAIYANQMTGILYLDALEDFIFSHEAPNLLAIHHGPRNPSESPLSDDYMFLRPFRRLPSKSTAQRGDRKPLVPSSCPRRSPSRSSR